MAPRADEEHARASFDRHLRLRGITDVEWDPLPNGDSKPPDFNLRIATETFAVEVTALYTQYAAADGGSVPEESIWMATERLTEEVEKEATQAGILCGGYVLTLDGPYDNFFSSKKQIKRYLLKFIADTQGVASTPNRPKFVEMVSGQRCAVNKYESDLDWVASGMLTDGGGWNWEIVSELRALVDAAVTTKAHKLRAVASPWVLLLLDRHHFARSEDYGKVLQVLEPEWGAPTSLARRFRSICVIQSNGDVYPLKVREV